MAMGRKSIKIASLADEFSSKVRLRVRRIAIYTNVIVQPCQVTGCQPQP
jgi:hypothetical protein